MAHNLNIVNGKASLFLVKEPAWHNLGTVLNNPPTIEEGIRYAGLDYTVEKAQNYFCRKGESVVTKMPNRFVTYRTDTGKPFEVVSDRYQVVQNIEAFNFFNPLMKQFDLTLETAGALGGGEEIFITAKAPSTIKIGNKDYVDYYLLITNRHDGKGMVQIILTPVRVVCNNTLSAALMQNAYKLAIKHNGNAEESIKDAQNGMIEMFTDSINLGEYYNLLNTIKIDDRQLSNYIVNSLGLLVDETTVTEDTLKKYSKDIQTLDELMEYAEVGPGQEIIKGTAWGAYNVVTGYFSNVKSYTNNASKLNSLNKDGVDFKVNQKALQLAGQLQF